MLFGFTCAIEGVPVRVSISYVAAVVKQAVKVSFDGVESSFMDIDPNY